MTANVISRARGQSIVAAAAYRLGVALRDQRYGVTHNYVGKRGVTYSEIMADERPSGRDGSVREDALDDGDSSETIFSMVASVFMKLTIY